MVADKQHAFVVGDDNRESTAIKEKAARTSAVKDLLGTQILLRFDLVSWRDLLIKISGQ